jgi:hypothetical protein
MYTVAGKLLKGGGGVRNDVFFFQAAVSIIHQHHNFSRKII